MFNMLVEPDKIVDFAVQNGAPCYRIRWCDSWISQESLSSTWQHLVEAFWKLKTSEQHHLNQQQQQQQQQLQQQQQPSPNDITNRYISTIHNNKFLPNFSSLLVANTGQTNLLPTSSTLHIPQQAQQQVIPGQLLETPGNSQQQQSIDATLSGNTLLAANELPTVPADFQIASLLEQSIQPQQTLLMVNNEKQPETPTPSTTSTSKQTNDKSASSTKTRVVRKVKSKTDCTKDQVKCTECSREFSQTVNPRKRLREHIRRVHLKNGKFSCAQCPKTFVCKQGLRDHEPVHSKERKHLCRYCSQTFLRLSHLYIHTRTHEEEKNFRCEACFATFSVQSELKDHCEGYHVDITVDIKCSVCKQNLFSSQSIYSHSLRHSGTRDWKCDDCGSAFKRKQILDQHKKRHETDKSARKNVRCDICTKDFTTRSTLREHVFLVHNAALEGAEHKCEVCGKCFRNWANYNRHVKLHPKVKGWVTIAKEQETEVGKVYNEDDVEVHEFTCNACKSPHSLVAEFLQHLREHQAELEAEENEGGENDGVKESGSSCDVCSKSFTCLKYLKKHMEMHGTLELKCDVCSMLFKRRDTLRIHKKRHIVRNETSGNFDGKDGEIYNSRKELRAKIGEADENGKVTCPYCEKLFNKRKLLLAHIVLHGDVFYTCETCGKSYKQRSCLNKHKRTHTSNATVSKRGRPKKNGKLNKQEANGESQSKASKGKYKCTTCSQGFTAQKVLAEHEITHKTLLINCMDCGLAFVSKETFERHIRVSHRNKNKVKQTSVEDDDPSKTINLPEKIVDKE